MGGGGPGVSRIQERAQWVWTQNECDYRDVGADLGTSKLRYPGSWCGLKRHELPVMCGTLGHQKRKCSGPCPWTKTSFSHTNAWDLGL